MTQILCNLQTETYEHPMDRRTLNAFKALPGADTVTNFVLNWTYIKWLTVQLAGSNFHVTRQSCPDLFNQVKQVADTLDIVRMPEIYTQWGYFVNAYTTGYDDATLLVIYSGAVDLMTEQEQKFIIGHEMGHIKSGHVLYHVMAQQITQIIANLSIAGNLIAPLSYALIYWMRMSEFTADRAGLLACQDLDVAISAIMKMAGLPSKYFDTKNKDAFLQQAEEFQETYGAGLLNNTIRTISIIDETHPWTIMRAAELVKWVNSGAYDAILNNTKGKRCLTHGCGRQVPSDVTVCPVCGGRNFEEIR